MCPDGPACLPELIEVLIEGWRGSRGEEEVGTLVPDSLLRHITQDDRRQGSRRRCTRRSCGCSTRRATRRATPATWPSGPTTHDRRMGEAENGQSLLLNGDDLVQSVGGLRGGGRRQCKHGEDAGGARKGVAHEDYGWGGGEGISGAGEKSTAFDGCALTPWPERGRYDWNMSTVRCQLPVRECACDESFLSSL